MLFNDLGPGQKKKGERLEYITNKHAGEPYVRIITRLLGTTGNLKILITKVVLDISLHLFGQFSIFTTVKGTYIYDEQ